MEKCSDEAQCLTVEDSDDDEDDGERVAGSGSNKELVFDGAVSSVQLSESSSWCRSVNTPSLDQLAIPRGNGQEDLHLSPPPQLKRQTGYINLPDAQSEDMHTESRAQFSMSHSCLLVPDDPVTEHGYSRDINHTSSFPVSSNWKVHKKSSSICSRHEELEMGGALQVKNATSPPTTPQDTPDTEPPLSPIHVHTPQCILPIPRSKRHLRRKVPAPLPSPPVPPRRASLQHSTRSPRSCCSTAEQQCLSSECSHHCTSAAKGSTAAVECRGNPCSIPAGVSPSMIHGCTDPGHVIREPSPSPPPIPPKTYKLSLPRTTVACTTMDSSPLPPHSGRQSALRSSTGTRTCVTRPRICGCGTCSLCNFEQTALQASQLLHTMHTPPHAHTTEGTLSCIIATWQS